MKKVIIFVVLVIFFSIFPVNAEGVKVFLDGIELAFDVEPTVINDRVMVPVRVVSESLGAEVIWVAETNQVAINLGNRWIEFFIGDDKVYIKNDVITVDVPPIIIDGRTMVPIRFVAENLGMNVSYDSDSRSVYIEHRLKDNLYTNSVYNIKAEILPGLVEYLPKYANQIAFTDEETMTETMAEIPLFQQILKTECSTIDELWTKNILVEEIDPEQIISKNDRQIIYTKKFDEAGIEFTIYTNLTEISGNVYIFLITNNKSISKLSETEILASLKSLEALNSVDDNSWEYIKNKGELIVGLEDTFAPMGFRNDDGELVGFDIDLAKAVAEKLEINLKFQPIDWSAKELELETKRIDCIWNGMSVTPARLLNLSATEPYISTRIVFMGKNADEITGFDDLSNKKIGLLTSSVADEILKERDEYKNIEPNIILVNSWEELAEELKAGRVDLILTDEITGLYKLSDYDIKVSEFSLNTDYYAVFFRIGEIELSNMINNAINDLIVSGEAKAISEKWFGRDLLIGQSAELIKYQNSTASENTTILFSADIPKTLHKNQPFTINTEWVINSHTDEFFKLQVIFKASGMAIYDVPLIKSSELKRGEKINIPINKATPPIALNGETEVIIVLKSESGSVEYNIGKVYIR